MFDPILAFIPKRHRIFFMAVAIFCATLCSCLFENHNHDSESPSTLPAKSLAYSVKVSSKAGALRCSVFVNILKWPATESVVFQLPAYYPDNPRMPVPGIAPSQIHVEDAYGKTLGITLTTPPFTQGGGTWITVPSSAAALNYEVDLDPGDSTSFGPPMPGIKAGVQMLDGSLLFILPSMGASLSHHWRNPVSLRLNWHIANGIALMGDSELNLNSNYQLMFYRGALNPARKLDVTIGSHTLTLYTTEARDSADLYTLEENMRHWIPLLEARLLPFPWEHLWVGTNTVHSGIEGIGGYWYKPEYITNPNVHFHEFTHSFIGVMQGDFDDAWFKEGVTNYVGIVLTEQDGGVYDSTLVAFLLQPYESVLSVNQYALSDASLRDRFYHPLDSNYADNPPVDFYTLLYGKGAEAAMQIDAWILRNSNGKHDLFEAVRTLYNTGETGFTRQQLTEVLQNLSGQRADTLLQSLCDKPGPFSVAQLQQALSTLRTFDRFHPSPYRVVMAKRGPILQSHGKILEKL